MTSLVPFTVVKTTVIRLLRENHLDMMADMVDYCSLVLFLPLVRSALARQYSFLMDPETDISVFLIPDAQNQNLPCVVCGDGRCFIMDPIKINQLRAETPWFFYETVTPPPSPLLHPLSDEDAMRIQDGLSLLTTIDDEQENRIGAVLMTGTLLVTP